MIVNTLWGETELLNTKRCSECGMEYPKTNQHFGMASGGNYLRGTCKSCDRKNSRITKFLKEQHPKPSKNHICPICKIDEQGILDKGYKIKWCLDHDHKTGKFRGYLCDNCNTAISKLKDSITILENAIKYLKQNLELC